MKSIQSTVENIWVEKISIELTDAQLEVITSETSSNEDKQVVCDIIRNGSEQPLSKSETLKVQAIYESNKPVIKETDVYEFISCDMYVGETSTGIINCRVNGEHKQVRF
jgi:hypothetical protein